MAAGAYNRRVTIQAGTESENADGQPVSAWADVADRWAKFMPAGGNERMRGVQLIAEASYILRLRADTMTRAITTKHRLLDPLTGQVFQVGRAYVVDRKEIELQVIERI